jgi:hypothetical protein
MQLQDENESLNDVSEREEDCNGDEGDEDDEVEDEGDGDDEVEDEGDDDDEVEDEGDDDDEVEDEGDDDEVEDEGDDDDEVEDEVEDVIDDSQSVLEIIWLTKAEFKSDLTTLLAGTSRRPKTVSNFVAPEIMRDTVKRCKEFPGGVYINIYGEICPDDPRTGVYRMISQGSVEVDPPFVEEDVSGDDESDVYNSESSSEDSEKESDEEDDDDWKEYERPVKKQKTSPGNLEISEEVPLTDEEKKSLFFTELQQASQDVESHYSSYSNSRKKNTYRLKLLHHTQALIEEWNVFRKKKKTSPFEMSYDSGVWCEEPFFEFSFKKKNVKDYVKASIDCDKMIVRCQCSTTSNTMKTFLEHLKISH